MSSLSNDQPPAIAQQPPQRSLLTLYGAQTIWFPVLALSALGLLFVYSSSSIYAGQKFGDEYLFFRKQLIFLGAALCAGMLGMYVNISILHRFATKLFALALFATFLTKVPYIGKKVGGASRWLSIFGFQIQPGEFLKIGSLLFACYVLSKHPQKIWHLWPLLLAFLALLLQPDFGTSVILFTGISAIILIHGIPGRAIGAAVLLILPMVIGILVSAPYRLRRLASFLDPFADPLGAGFQVIQSFVAIASGGWFGKGLGASQQKLFFLPEAHTDFILAVIAEEMGFAGVAVIVLMYGLLFLAIFQVIMRLEDHLSRLLASGIFAMLASSTLVNMGVVAGLLPTKGLPLPFVSSGGSSLIASYFMIGLLSQIHRRSLETTSETHAMMLSKIRSDLGRIPSLRINSDV